MNYRKKGQMGSGTMLALIIGVGVGVLVLIFIGVLGGQVYNLSESRIAAIGNNSYNNANVTIINTSTATTTYLGHTNILTGSLTITNTSNGAVMGLSNFTVDYTAGTLYPDPDVPYLANTSSINVSYDHGDLGIQNNVKGGILSSFEALEQTGDYLPIIVLAFIIFIVMGIVIGMGLINKNMGGGNSVL